MSKVYDVLFIGAGPASLYGALELLSKNKSLSIAIIEKGHKLENRTCPAIEAKTSCMKCRVCSIMSGVAGAGAFSDGKFPMTNDFGGSLAEKIGQDKSFALQKEVDKTNYRLFQSSGYSGEFPKVFSSYKSIFKTLCLKHDLKLLGADIRHLGTDKARIIFNELKNELINKGIEFFTDEEVLSVIKSPESYLIQSKNSNDLKIYINGG